jgi:N-acetylmuramoyl-L-alanine amidase
MSRFSARYIPLCLIALVLLAALAFWIFKPVLPAPALPPSGKESLSAGSLSALAPPPDWNSLEIYQDTISRAEFDESLTTLFTTGEAWRKFIQITETAAHIQTGEAPPANVFTLRFAPLGQTNAAARHWKTAAELPTAPRNRPLTGLHIAIDPGHIGGDWAKMEERWFIVGEGQPVREGDMTLHVAQLLKPRLEALGATISLVRDRNEPVTPLRPDSLTSLAQDSSDPARPESLQKLAERLFYRTAEIRARADLVNKTLKPDLVLCLHFNAEAWGDPLNPTLIDRTHLHLLINGGYNNEEVALADQRFALLEKLLQRTHQEGILIGSTVATTFAEISGLPPYQYPTESKNARAIAGQPFLWARNLLANRLYDCPVIFMEPYVMNSTVDYARIQAGDYSGTREIAGKMRHSIFQEYAVALTEGLKRHYEKSRASSF